MGKSLTEIWYVVRQDTHGREYLFSKESDKETAETIAKKHNDKGHHQTYWVTQKLPENILR